jgi:integrase
MISRAPRLTQDVVHRAVMRGEPTTLRDGHGLLLVIAKREAKWIHEYRLRGRDPCSGRRHNRKQLVLERYTPAFRLAEARAENAAVHARVLAGHDVLAEQREARRDTLAQRHAPDALTMGDLVRRFTALRQGDWRPQTRKAFSGDLRDIVAGLGSLRVAEITRTHLTTFLLDFVAAQQRTGRRGTRAQRIRMLLSSLFLYALDEGIVTTTPAIRLKLPSSSRTRTRERVLDAGEITSTWRALDRLATPTTLALQLSLVTGARIGAVCAADAAELSVDGKLDGTSDGKPVWRIPGTVGRKAKATQTMPLSALAVALWRRALAWPGRNPDGPVFPGRTTGRSLQQNSVTCAWRRWHYTGLLPAGTTPHDLRRSARSWWSGLPHGQPRDILERLLGHSVGHRVERTYDRSLYLPQQRAVADAWAAWLQQTTAGPATVEQLMRRRA